MGEGSLKKKKEKKKRSGMEGSYEGRGRRRPVGETAIGGREDHIRVS